MKSELDFQGTRRYRPTRLLGMGGMGAVYEVVDAQTQARLALKVMLIQEPQRLLRFKQEFRIVAELHHKNLVRLFDLGQEAGRWFFTMELVHGRDLLEKLHQVRPPDETTIDPTSPPPASISVAEKRAPDNALACELSAFRDAMLQIVDALEFLHAQALVHRDLKPSNIVVEPNGVVRLLDFGLASRVERDAIASAENGHAGTLSYMSPEQCRGEAATPASDLYALGCMMFQLLTGQLPFVGSPSQIINARLSRTPPRVQRRVLGVPEEIAEIAYRLMARNPADRPSLRQVRAALLHSDHEIPHAREQATHLHLAADKSLPFVGRKHESEELRASLQRALHGSAQWVLVSGESGIGKSALAAVLIAEAEQQGFLCVSGRCYEREQVPFIAFDRAVDALIVKLAAWPADRRAALADSLEMLRPVFPAVGILSEKRPKEIPAQPAPDPRDQYRRAAAGLCHLLEYCQSQAPLLLTLDDLQWADEESIELLAALLAGCNGRLLLLGLSRPEGLAVDRPLHRLLPRASCVVSLPGLTSAEVAQLAAEVADAGLPHDAAHSLFARSAGNPFLALQLLGHLATPILSTRAEQLLATAATVGGDSSRRLLAAASGLQVADFDLALAELLSARLLKALPVPVAEGTLERLDLYHDRIRETAYARLLPERRKALHRTLAETLEAQPAPSGPLFEALLRHWTEAGDRDKQRHFTAKAAQQATEKLAFRRAAQLFRSLLDDGPLDEAPPIIAARWERVGELWEFSGQLNEAADAYARALALWERASSDTQREVALLRLRGRVAENLMANGQIADGRAVYASGLAAMGLRLDRSKIFQLATILGLQGKLALTELFAWWPWQTPREATPLERAQLRFFDEMVRAMTLLWVLPAMEAMTRCELLARRFVDWRLLHHITVNKVRGAALLGRTRQRQLGRFHAILDDAAALARKHEIPLGNESVQLTRSLLFFWDANYARARRENEDAQAGYAKQGMADSYDCVVARMIYMTILFVDGDDDRLMTVIEREQAASFPNFYNAIAAISFKARILARRGQHHEATAAILRTQQLLANAPACMLMLFPAVASITVFTAQGYFKRALDEAERARELLRQLGFPIIDFLRSTLHEVFLDAALGLNRQGLLFGKPRVRAYAAAAALAYRGAIDLPCMGFRALALLTHADGRTEVARRALAQALAHSRTNTNPYHRWLCLLAAQELHAADLTLLREADALAEKHQFVPPRTMTPT